MLPTTKYRELLAAVCHLYNLPQGMGFLPEEWLEGMILTESSGNPKAHRFELHQDRGPDPDTPGVDDLTFEDDCSYGLMQVMGYNARKLLNLPFQEFDYSFLYNPLINIELGLMILKGELAATGGDLKRALARYNGGWRGDIIEDGRMRRQDYVDKVIAYSLKVRYDNQIR